MEDISRRDFLKKSALSTLVLTAASSEVVAMAAPAADLQSDIVAALGDLFVPSAPGDPGYEDLEKYGITEYVLKNLPLQGDVLETFNETAKQFFGGKSFLELDEKQKEQYLGYILDAQKIMDAQARTQLLAFYRAARTRILTVYYRNYPEHEVKHNPDGTIIFKPGDTHQITNLNTKEIVTGWDITGYKGPLNWEDEEQQRAYMKNRFIPWQEGDFVRRNGTVAAPAIKTSDGKDYYDVVVVGGGMAGCIVAGRLAERGMNPKTGDRLRVVMIEAGDDWTVRDPGLRPGYGSPIRRSMIPNINYDPLGPEGAAPAPQYDYPYEGFGFKVVGGCSIHWGRHAYLPEEDDYQIYRETSGVDWTFGKAEAAIEEIRVMFGINFGMPEELYPRGVQMFTGAGRAMGFDMRPGQLARKNCLDCGYCGDGSICRYDSASTTLPWAYIGLNNGMKLIANAEVQKVLIEKVAGGRPVATGVVYKDKAGTMHEVRAARIIVATGTVGVPLLLYASGYGPREFLGDKLLVENKNVGHNMDGDSGSPRIEALWPEPIRPVRGASAYTWTSLNRKPGVRGELTVKITSSAMASLHNKYPDPAALSEFAPEFGIAHKNFMRDAWRRVGYLTKYLEVLPWSWRVTPEGRFERVSIDEAPINAVIKEATDLNYAIYDKMDMRPLKVGKPRGDARSLRPGHEQGTARAGSSRENSVCTSDFDCHDIENLIITSAASVPRRTFALSGCPVAVAAAYAWRRIVANHFSRGSSTRGFA